jgi:hypothetical protein
MIWPTATQSDVLWDSSCPRTKGNADLARQPQIGIRGLPHLAKNERDVGHPLVRGQEKSPTTGSHVFAQIWCYSLVHDSIAD